MLSSPLTVLPLFIKNGTTLEYEVPKDIVVKLDTPFYVVAPFYAVDTPLDTPFYVVAHTILDTPFYGVDTLFYVVAT